MDTIKNIQKSVTDNLPEMPNVNVPSTNAVKTGITSSISNVSSSVSGIQSSVQNTLGDFSSKNMVNGSKDFLQSNSMVAKFAFLVLVLIVFIVLLNIGIILIGYFTTPSKSPYVVKGLITGNNTVIVPQDPRQANSTTIARSNNQSTGIEFTWSVWLLVTGVDSSQKYTNVFNKGDAQYDKTMTGTVPTGDNGLAIGANGPGLYLIKENGAIHLYTLMDTVTSREGIIVKDIPINKWFNVMIRMQNKVLDVYVNGTVSNRTLLSSVPKQNYYDVNVCGNGGFHGNLSDLKYFDHALTTYQINKVVKSGPNTSTSSLALSNGGKGTNYISSLWYSSKF
jgi:hypothetical protein